jgi:hypothetical protein
MREGHAMRVAFRATQVDWDEDEYALICGLTGADANGREHGLCFQRSPEGDDPAEDWGVYLEFDSQGQAEYNRVAGCRLGRDRLAVDLSGPLGSLDGVSGFDVELAVDDAEFEQLVAGLPRIFRGTIGLLT